MGSIEIRDVVDGAQRARELFRHRYRQDPPEPPHHVIAFHRSPAGVETPVCYVHFAPFGAVLLGGGACVDDREMRRMDVSTRMQLRHRGGLYRMTLDWALRYFAPEYSAIFGYCGDKLAERIDLAAGFERTAHTHLLVRWTREIGAEQRAQLIAQAHAVGPF